jgi:hypothetical protein
VALAFAEGVTAAGDGGVRGEQPRSASTRATVFDIRSIAAASVRVNEFETGFVKFTEQQPLSSVAG